MVFMRVFLQLYASLPSYLLMMKLGSTISLIVIVVADLLNAHGDLSFDDDQASWFGSIIYISQPIGNFLSGLLADYCGRKRGLFLVTIPHTVGWLFIYYSWNVASLYSAIAIIGFIAGLQESSVHCYLGEMSQPRFRSMFSSMIMFNYGFGALVCYFLGTIISWRIIALYCAAISILTMLVVLTIPESPDWYLFHGRDNDALKSLCRLRGWCSSEAVEKELQELKMHRKDANTCIICEHDDQCDHININFVKRSLLILKTLLWSKATRRPLQLLILYMIFIVMGGITPTRPNLVNFCGAFGMAMDGKSISVISGVLTLVAGVTTFIGVKLFGRRMFAISAMFGSSVVCLLMSIYAKFKISVDVYSFNADTFPTEKSYIPVFLFCLLTFLNMTAVQWLLLGEIFPIRGRGIAQSIALLAFYIFNFVSIKTYINLERYCRLWGTFAVYGGFTLVGTIYLYLYLPETEGKYLHEIESFFSGSKMRVSQTRFYKYEKHNHQKPLLRK